MTCVSLCPTADDDFSRHIQRAQLTYNCIPHLKSLQTECYFPCTHSSASDFTWSPSRTHSAQASSKCTTKLHSNICEALRALQYSCVKFTAQKGRPTVKKGPATELELGTYALLWIFNQVCHRSQSRSSVPNHP